MNTITFKISPTARIWYRSIKIDGKNVFAIEEVKVAVFVNHRNSLIFCLNFMLLLYHMILLSYIHWTFVDQPLVIFLHFRADLQCWHRKQSVVTIFIAEKIKFVLT